MRHSSQNNQANRLAIGNADGEPAIAAHQQIDPKASLLDIEINVLTRHSSSLLTELINHMLQPAKLSCVCYFAMMYLHGSMNNRANPSQISRAIGDTRTNMTRICDELVTKGLVRRVPNAEDRRRVDLSLTQQGIAALQDTVPLVRKRVEEVMSEFLPEEKTLLIRLMTRLNRSIQAHL
jgi:MarR family transcriptional repressor of emrRAB